jgi:hypothetical protein
MKHIKLFEEISTAHATKNVDSGQSSDSMDKIRQKRRIGRYINPELLKTAKNMGFELTKTSDGDPIIQYVNPNTKENIDLIVKLWSNSNDTYQWMNSEHDRNSYPFGVWDKIQQLIPIIKQDFLNEK